jgi:hypothetical protein
VAIKQMDNPEKLATQDEEKQNHKNTTHMCCRPLYTNNKNQMSLRGTKPKGLRKITISKDDLP